MLVAWMFTRVILLFGLIPLSLCNVFLCLLLQILFKVYFVYFWQLGNQPGLMHHRRFFQKQTVSFGLHTTEGIFGGWCSVSIFAAVFLDNSWASVGLSEVWCSCSQYAKFESALIWWTLSASWWLPGYLPHTSLVPPDLFQWLSLKAASRGYQDSQWTGPFLKLPQTWCWQQTASVISVASLTCLQVQQSSDQL